MTTKISSKSTVYLRQRIETYENGVLADPTGSNVFLQLQTPGADPDDDAWVAGTWETDATVEPNRYYANLLVGPSGNFVTSDGTYTLWVKIVDSPEIPIIPGDTVVIT